MTAQEYLQQVRLKSAAIDNLKREKEEIRQILYSIGGNISNERVQTSRNVDKFGTLYGRIDEKEKQIDDKIWEFIEFKLKVSEEINSLRDTRFVNLLYMKYIQFKRWDEIADTMEYSTRYVQKLHGYALEEFQKKYIHM